MSRNVFHFVTLVVQKTSCVEEGGSFFFVSSLYITVSLPSEPDILTQRA